MTAPDSETDAAVISRSRLQPDAFALLTLVLVTHDTAIARRSQRTGVMTDGHLAGG